MQCGFFFNKSKKKTCFHFQLTLQFTLTLVTDYRWLFRVIFFYILYSLIIRFGLQYFYSWIFMPNYGEASVRSEIATRHVDEGILLTLRQTAWMVGEGRWRHGRLPRPTSSVNVRGGFVATPVLLFYLNTATSCVCHSDSEKRFHRIIIMGSYNKGNRKLNLWHIYDIYIESIYIIS